MAHETCCVSDPPPEPALSPCSSPSVSDVVLSCVPVSCSTVPECLAVDVPPSTGNGSPTGGSRPQSARSDRLCDGNSQRIPGPESCVQRGGSECVFRHPVEDPSLCSGPSPGLTSESLQGAPSPGSAVSNGARPLSRATSPSTLSSSCPALASPCRPRGLEIRNPGLELHKQSLFDEDVEEVEHLMRVLYVFAGHLSSVLGGPSAGKHVNYAEEKKERGCAAALASLPSIALLEFHASTEPTGSVFSRRFPLGILQSRVHETSPFSPSETQNLPLHHGTILPQGSLGTGEFLPSEPESSGLEAARPSPRSSHTISVSSTHLQQSYQTSLASAAELHLKIVQLLVRLTGDPPMSSPVSQECRDRHASQAPLPRRPGSQEAKTCHCRLHHAKRYRLVETQLEELRREQEQEGGESEPEDEDPGSSQSVTSSSEDSVDGDREREDKEGTRGGRDKRADRQESYLEGSVSFEDPCFAEHTEGEGHRRQSVFSPRGKKGRAFRLADTGKIQKILVSARARRKRLLLTEWQKQKFERHLFRRLSRVYQFFCRVRSSPTALSAFLLLLLATPGDSEDMLLLVLAACWRLCDQCEAAAVAADAAEARNCAVADADECVPAGRPYVCRPRSKTDRESNDRSPCVLSGSGDDFSTGSLHMAAAVAPRSARGGVEEHRGEQQGDTEVVFPSGWSIVGQVCGCCPLAVLARAECVEYVRGFIASLLPFLLWMYTSRCLLPPHQLCVLHNLLPALDALHFLSLHSSSNGRNTGNSENPSVPSLDRVLASSFFVSNLPDNVSGLEALLLLFAATPSPLASSAVADATTGKAPSLAAGGDFPAFLAPGPPMVSVGSAAAVLSPHVVLPCGSLDSEDRLASLTSCASAVAGATSTTAGPGSGALGVLCPWIFPSQNQPAHASGRSGRLKEGLGSHACSGELIRASVGLLGCDFEGRAGAVIASQEAVYADFVRILTGRWDFAFRRQAPAGFCRSVAQAPETQTTPVGHLASASQPGDTPSPSRTKGGGSGVGGEGDERSAFGGGGSPVGLPVGLTPDGQTADQASAHAPSRKDPAGNASPTGVGIHTGEALSEAPRDFGQASRVGSPVKLEFVPGSNGESVVLVRSPITPPLLRVTAARQQDLLARCLAAFSFYSGVCAAVERRARSRLVSKSGVQGDTWAQLLTHDILEHGKGVVLDGKNRWPAEEPGGLHKGRETTESKFRSLPPDPQLALERAVVQTENKVFLSPDEHLGLITAAFLASLSRSDAFEPVSMAHALPQPLGALVQRVGVHDCRTFTAEEDGFAGADVDTAACVAACTCSSCYPRSKCISSSAGDPSQFYGTIRASAACEPPEKRSLDDLIAYVVYGDDGVTAPQCVASQHKTIKPQLSDTGYQQTVRNDCTLGQVLQSTVDPWSTGRIRAPVSDALLLQAASTTGRLLFELTRKDLSVSYEAGGKRARRTGPACEGGQRADGDGQQEEGEEEAAWWTEAVLLALRHQHRMFRILDELMRLAHRGHSQDASEIRSLPCDPAASRTLQHGSAQSLSLSEGTKDRDVEYDVSPVHLTEPEFLLMLLVHQTHHFQCRCRSVQDQGSCDLAHSLARRHFFRNSSECVLEMSMRDTDARRERREKRSEAQKGGDESEPERSPGNVRVEVGNGSAEEEQNDVVVFGDEESFPYEAWTWIRTQLLARHLRNVLKTGQQRAEAEMLLRSYWVFTALRHTLG